MMGRPRLDGEVGPPAPSLSQAQAPTTVGDTVWLARTIAAPAGSTIRPADWDPPDPIERLGPPRVILQGDSAAVSYAVVVWRTGPLTVELPGPVVQGPDGGIDSLPSQSISLAVSSVLPATSPDSSLAPQPRADIVPRSSASAVPLLVLLAVSAVLLAPLHWWWRRRGRPGPQLVEATAVRPDLPLQRWADAGELRAVASAAASRLRGRIAERLPSAHAGLDTEDLLRAPAVRDDWPLGELGDLLRALEEARFGHSAFPDAIGLARWADELAPRLVPRPPVEAA